MPIEGMPNPEELAAIRAEARQTKQFGQAQETESAAGREAFYANPARFLDGVPSALEEAARRDENEAHVDIGTSLSELYTLLRDSAKVAAEQLQAEGWSARTSHSETPHWTRSDSEDGGLEKFYVRLFVAVPEIT